MLKNSMVENEVLLKRSKMLSPIITGRENYIYFLLFQCCKINKNFSFLAVSNFSVQYNFQAISIALLVMSETVCTSTEADCIAGTQKEWVTSTASAVVFIGAILGQLTVS